MKHWCAALFLACACGGAPDALDAGVDARTRDAFGDDSSDVPLARCVITGESGMREVSPECRYEIDGNGDILELWSSDGFLTLDGRRAEHHDPRVYTSTLELEVEGTVLHVRNHGRPTSDVFIERSLAWTDAELLDVAGVVGLAPVLLAASDGNAGPLLAQWFERFSTTAHSERLGPLALLDKIREQEGDDASLWTLDDAPFRVTGVHNRIDLRDGVHCGEFRVSLASTDPVLQPFHIIALFEQAAQPDDLRPDGSAHCVHTSLRWARLSALEEDEALDGAALLFGEYLTHENFRAMESLDFLISPWEWRQWFPSDEGLQNAPLFQTVDTPRLNQPGALRDDFLRYVEENAEALNERRASIPERFRAESARVNDGVPWIPLNLDPLEATLGDSFPELRQNIEIVGCPACHVADAPFVQTDADRRFSPFYMKELEARRDALVAMQNGGAQTPNFGPLQAGAVLTP